MRQASEAGRPGGGGARVARNMDTSLSGHEKTKGAYFTRGFYQKYCLPDENSIPDFLGAGFRSVIKGGLCYGRDCGSGNGNQVENPV